MLTRLERTPQATRNLGHLKVGERLPDLLGGRHVGDTFTREQPLCSLEVSIREELSSSRELDHALRGVRVLLAISTAYSILIQGGVVTRSEDLRHVEVDRDGRSVLLLYVELQGLVESVAVRELRVQVCEEQTTSWVPERETIQRVGEDQRADLAASTVDLCLRFPNTRVRKDVLVQGDSRVSTDGRGQVVDRGCRDPRQGDRPSLRAWSLDVLIGESLSVLKIREPGRTNARRVEERERLDDLSGEEASAT